jgi:sn-glycerol 3-phosphate transport system substrate-binding protein
MTAVTVSGTTPSASRRGRGGRCRRSTVRIGVAMVAALLAAACGSGKSALDAGNDDSPPAVVPTDVVPASTPGGADGSSTSTAPSTVGPTTTQAPLADLPECPVDALDDRDSADGPVEITFWHGLANELETSLIALTDEYNASQDRVVVNLQNQTSYDSAIDKYIQSSQDSRPTLVQFPEYTVQSFAQSDTLIPVQACIEASGYDTSAFLSRTLDAYTFEGIQWSMPFNVSNPVLYYNRKVFEAAGLDPDVTPVTLEELRATSQTIVDSGAASYGWVVDSGADSGGGWFLEQWFGRAGELYADNGNGRLAPATKVLYDDATGVELLTYVQSMINDGLAVSVGQNPGGQDGFLKMIDPASPGAMTIGTSAALGSVIAALGGGLAPGLTVDDIGVGPMPGPSAEPGAQVGGASLWIVADKGDAETAAAWDFITYLVSAETQSRWASETGYVPVRSDAVELEPLVTTYADDPRFKVPYDQLQASVDDPAALSPVLGPQREVRVATANAVAAIFSGADVATALADAAAQSNALIDSYNQRN